MKLLPAILFSAPLLAGAVPEVRRTLQACRSATPIAIDGKHTESAWAMAQAASGFSVQWPDFGKPARLGTDVRILYDDSFLYVGARMHHLKGKAQVIKRIHRRDQDSLSDWFSVMIDSVHDRRTAFVFQVNAAGVQRDQVIYGDTTWDSSWDGVWESGVSSDEDGWTAELKIPLSLLRIRGGDGPQTWGVNFTRQDQGPIREFSTWDLVPRGVNALVSRFPDLTGIEGISPQPRREWIPYASLQKKFETARPYDDRAWTPRIGLDVHLGLTPSSQLDLTARPDFGQVEVDEVVLNLGTVETYYPEKRPFFLEGMEIFQVAGPKLFYSRRIGKGLPGPILAEGESVVDSPAATEILGAAKYTAKLDGGLNLGALGAVVEPAKATLLTSGGQFLKRELYPLTSFGVLRAQQNLDDRGSYVGAFASMVRAYAPSGRTAQVGAVDAVYKWPGHGTLLESTVSRSRTGIPGNQVDGWRARVRARQSWANGFSLEVQSVNAGRYYDPNDLGYQERADERTLLIAATRTWDKAWYFLRNWTLGGSAGTSRDQAGRAYKRYAETYFSTDTMTFNALTLGLGTRFPVEDDRELRTFRDPVKKYLHRDRMPYAWMTLDTAGNKPWYGRVGLFREWHPGGPSMDYSLYQAVKPSSSLELQFNTSYTRDQGELMYYRTTEDGEPVVGLRRLSKFSQTVRISYGFSPSLTIQAFAQWFAANYNYRDLQAYVDDRSLRQVAPEPGMAFSMRNWTLNLITRWEFRPGSTAFLVYTHGVESDALINSRASLSPRRDLAALGSLPSDDAVQVKVSWLFR